MSSPSRTVIKAILFWELRVSYELDQMSRYLDLVQGSLNSNYEELEARYAEMVVEGDSTSETISFGSDEYEDEFLEATQDFPQLVLLSFIVIWYSFVEQNLLDLCEQLMLRIEIRPRDSEKSDKGIWRARRFLLREKGYEVDADHWRELTEINRLRNFIVHEGKRIEFSYVQSEGRLDPVRYQTDGGAVVFLRIGQELFRYIQKRGISTSRGPIVEILPSIEYCKSLVDLARRLFRKLYADLS